MKNLIMQTRYKRAFTLIELLVVISIIAVLAAILFPVFARARENARRSSCMSNMKQLGLAFMQYTQDFDEQLPINGSTSSTNPGTRSWDVCIAPYTGVKVGGGASPLIFRCPSDVAKEGKRSYAVIYTGNYAPGAPSNAGLEYASGTFGYDRNLSLMRGVHTASIPEPATTLLLVELPSSPDGVTTADPTYTNNSFGNYSNSYAQDITGNTNAQDRAKPGHTAHLDGWNYLFSDGHVKWLKPEATMAGGTKHRGNMWARIKQ